MSFIAFLVALLAGGPSTAAEGKESLRWVLLDFPPFLDIDDSYADQEVTLEKIKGPIADIHRELEKSLPNFEHSYRMVSFLRAQKLFESKQHHCTILFLKTPEREKYLVYGGLIASTIPPGLVIDDKRRDQIQGFLNKDGVDLHQLLTQSPFRLGIVEGRSFSPQVDRSLNASQKPITRFVTDKAMGNIFQMISSNRLDGALAYYLEMANEQKENPRTQSLHFYPLKQEQTTINLRVSCEKSPWGNATVKKVSEAARNESVKAKISTLLMQTLPPEARKPALERHNSLQ